MRIARFLASLALASGFAFGPVTAGSQEVLVFAAASTTNAVAEIADLFTKSAQGTVKTSFAASSALAKQIEHGAPAQVFISADEKWMNYVADKKLVDPASRVDLLGNRLALIAPADSKVAAKVVAPGIDLGALLAGGRLATGDPDHVPVGLYAKAALQKLGAWDGVAPRLARAESVRAALAFVERGEAPLGIVYTTDAAVTTKVRVVGVFPADSHPPIVYPAALVAGQENVAGKAFFTFLQGPEAKAVFQKYGFEVK